MLKSLRIIRRKMSLQTISEVPGRLVPANPVPSDIEVSQSTPVVNIAKIAESIGILPSEFDLMGSTKAKVSSGSAVDIECCCQLNVHL